MDKVPTASGWLFTEETLIAGVIAVTLVAFLYLAIEAAKRKVVAEFQRGMASHYLSEQTPLERKGELVVFRPGEVSCSQFLFLAIIWILRQADPKVSLDDIRFPAVIRDRN